MAEKQPVQKATPQEFLEAVTKLGKEMGYGLAPNVEFFQQDNGTFSIKPTIVIVETQENKK